MLATLALILAACGNSFTEGEDPEPAESPNPTSTLSPTPESTSTPPEPPDTPISDADARPAYPFEQSPEPGFDPEERFRAMGGPEGWKTNFSKHSIDYTEIRFGGPIKDGIPAIDDPEFLPVNPPPTWLAENEPVISFEIAGDARAYPLQILTWHEIVNDVVGGEPVAITFCPLCNTAIAFSRMVDGFLYDFGVSGALRVSNQIMYDRQTESWWQQIGGDAIVGELTGARLTPLPASIVSWKDFRESFPDGLVLSRDTGYQRRYGFNPYAGYDDVASSPFLANEDDDRLAAVERVVTVELGEDVVAYPFRELEKSPIVNDLVDGTPLVVFFTEGTISVLDDTVIANSRDVGATGVFSRILDSQELTFDFDGERLLDTNSGSTWNILGRAVDGPMRGKVLEPVVHGNHLWFSWVIFKPETKVWKAPM